MGRLSCRARNGRFGAQGKKTSRPLRMPIEPSFRSAVFGQTCPIETAVGEPVAVRKEYGNGAIER
ncbi:hypothetical protein J2Z75_005055 [Rhizobium herbae]|uniref:Uncharacterized protein n=1 Tax=Rhizobium herbae TaxID=508661 RepID=A0ABS4EUA0_9HYPH|nr:hypothetical protein [Rhizobium herbae]